MKLDPATRLLIGASGVALGAALALDLAGKPGLSLLAIVLSVALALTVLAHLLRRETRS